MKEITLKIDNRSVTVPEGTTILDAAAQIGLTIPALCHMDLKELCIRNAPASCRICVVEVEGRRNLAPACATRCTEGMAVRTATARVQKARRTVLELILSNHPTSCLVCAKSGKCELQKLAETLRVREIPFTRELTNDRRETTVSIVRDMNKCIYCRRCETMCNDVQSVGALGAANRGFEATVTPAFGQSLRVSECTFCGQCVAVCPVGALTQNTHIDRLLADLADPGKTVVVQTAPAVRVALGEEFGLPAGTPVTGKMVSALRRLGFDRVFDTDFAADVTIMEEGSEFLKRFNACLEGDPRTKLPIITSCCPAWVKFYETQFPDLLDYPSTARSPQQMFGALAKNWLAKKLDVPRENLIVVSIMPCIAKKFESSREEFAVDGDPDVNYSLSTRELGDLIRSRGIDFDRLPDEAFDHPMGRSTGAALIFGASGGVMEAALRTACEVRTGKTLEKLEFEPVRGLNGFREATVMLDGIEVKAAVVNGLGNARKLMDEIRAGKSPYHIIEVMACPGGCIGGGGQPYHHGDSNVLKARQAAIYREEESMPLRKSHENPDVARLYEEFLGRPLGKEAHRLLHTVYINRSNLTE